MYDFLMELQQFTDKTTKAPKKQCYIQENIPQETSTINTSSYKLLYLHTFYFQTNTHTYTPIFKVVIKAFINAH